MEYFLIQWLDIIKRYELISQQENNSSSSSSSSSSSNNRNSQPDLLRLADKFGRV